ncbi:MAG: hypothetical protein ACRC6T_16275 [Sarcina sp.]
MTTESWILILVLLGVVIFRQLGERRFTLKSLIIQACTLSYFTYEYVTDVPTGGVNTQILVGATAVGIILGVFMLMATKRYRKDGKNYVKSGIPYLILWIIGLGSKVVLVDYITKWNVRGSDIFIMQHHINPDVIAPAFMFLTIAMILVRTIGIYITFAMLNKKVKMEVVAV